MATTTLHRHSLGGDTKESNTAWVRPLWVHSSLFSKSFTLSTWQSLW